MAPLIIIIPKVQPEMAEVGCWLCSAFPSFGKKYVHAFTPCQALSRISQEFWLRTLRANRSAPNHHALIGLPKCHLRWRAQLTSISWRFPLMDEPRMAVRAVASVRGRRAREEWKSRRQKPGG